VGTVKIRSQAERDAALKKLVETTHYFDRETGDMYTPDDEAPPVVIDPEGDADSEVLSDDDE
jgi:hypothetical protein